MQIPFVLFVVGFNFLCEFY